MLKMLRKNIARSVVLFVGLSAGLAAGLAIAGMAAAQETGSMAATPGSGGQAGDGMITQVAGMDAGGAKGMARSDADATKAVPSSRMTWESVAPQLDPFGNETVPVFDSAYSGREPVR
jgi:hypothetical protein